MYTNAFDGSLPTEFGNLSQLCKWGGAGASMIL